MLDGRRTSSKLPELVELVINTSRVGRHGGKDVQRDAAGGAGDCFGVGLKRDDAEREVPGMGLACTQVRIFPLSPRAESARPALLLGIVRAWVERAKGIRWTSDIRYS